MSSSALVRSMSTLLCVGLYFVGQYGQRCKSKQNKSHAQSSHSSSSASIKTWAILPRLTSCVLRTYFQIYLHTYVLRMQRRATAWKRLAICTLGTWSLRWRPTLGQVPKVPAATCPPVSSSRMQICTYISASNSVLYSRIANPKRQRTHFHTHLVV